MKENLRALRRHHQRLEVVARALVEDARLASEPDQALVQAHLLRRLLRELDGEPQPSALDTVAYETMSVS